MNLLINTSSLIPPITGIGRYTQQLIKCLLSDSRISDIKAFSQLSVYDRQMLSEIVFETAATPIDNEQGRRLAIVKKYLRHVPGLYSLRSGIQRQRIKKLINKQSDAVYWEPNYVLQDFSGPRIATLHDLSYLRYPQYHHKAMLTWLNKQLPKTIERADAFVTLSEFSKTELVQGLGIDPQKIHIIPPAVDDTYRVKATQLQLQQVKRRYQLPDQYILTVSTLEPRKNINGLIAAYSQLPEALKNQYPLVIAGAGGWGKEDYQKNYRQLIAKQQLYFLGYVSQNDLPLIYQASELFAFLSFYEGYGMPVAEAMASGVAVLSSNQASMPEVAQGSAMLVEPDDNQAIVHAFNTLLEDRELRQQMQQNGRRVSQHYTWQKSADLLVDLSLSFGGKA
ncbi:MAG: glycosyltransferase family 4 protein [Gammaproteobacteria bacterium]